MDTTLTLTRTTVLRTGATVYRLPGSSVALLVPKTAVADGRELPETLSMTLPEGVLARRAAKPRKALDPKPSVELAKTMQWRQALLALRKNFAKQLAVASDETEREHLATALRLVDDGATADDPIPFPILSLLVNKPGLAATVRRIRMLADQTKR